MGGGGFIDVIIQDFKTFKDQLNTNIKRRAFIKQNKTFFLPCFFSLGLFRYDVILRGAREGGISQNVTIEDNSSGVFAPVSAHA